MLTASVAAESIQKQATYLCTCQHDNDSAPLLKHHLPELPHSVRQRPLRGDVGPLGNCPFLAGHETGIDVVRCPAGQLNSVLVKGNHIDIAVALRVCCGG